MKLKRFKPVPVFLTLLVLAAVCGLRLARLNFFTQLENITYDARMRAALHFPAQTATNLAFVFMDESSIRAVQDGSVGFHFGLYWPREVYGRVVAELAQQRAKAAAFDVLFKDLRPDHPLVEMTDGSFIHSDGYFALQLRRAHNVILADTGDATLPDLFTTNALALGDASTDNDSDGRLRRARAFTDYRRWNPLFQHAAAEYGLDLDGAKIEPGKIILPQIGTTNVVVVPVDAQDDFAVANFIGTNLPPGMAATARAFTMQRVWQMGIVLAAQALHLDLAHARVDLARGQIVLSGRGGVQRVIPVDAAGRFYINWRMTPNDPHLLREPIQGLLAENFLRLQGRTNGLPDAFRGKLVVIGSAAQGNDLADRGATPLSRSTLLAGAYWNIANSVLTGRFIRRASLPLELAVIIIAGLITAFLTWRLRTLAASGAIVLFMLFYTAAAFWTFIRFRFCLPLVFPIVGAMLMEHLMLVTYRVMFEEGQKRRVKSVFSKIVAPDIVNELLEAKTLALGGTRREVTVYFADIRGFTSFTDQSQARLLEYIADRQLSDADVEAAVNEEAREALSTINLYLGAVAGVIKRHNGTLDKYIGDCVMAFWGAPVSNDRQAVDCVEAAIEAQRAIYRLNLDRVAENQRRELQNIVAGAGVPRHKLPILTLGSGINTGMATVGLMGSNEHLFNYTVFGREVNLASRLETVSGHGRIIISDTTFRHLLRHDPALARACVALPPVKVKGIAAEVIIYEVPWRPAEGSPFDEELFSGKPSEGTSFTGIARREGA